MSISGQNALDRTETRNQGDDQPRSVPQPLAGQLWSRRCDCRCAGCSKPAASEDCARRRCRGGGAGAVRQNLARAGRSSVVPARGTRT
eukprot:1511502-Prymnesium_polylepis.1